MWKKQTFVLPGNTVGVLGSPCLWSEMPMTEKCVNSFKPEGNELQQQEITMMILLSDKNRRVRLWKWKIGKMLLVSHSEGRVRIYHESMDQSSLVSTVQGGDGGGVVGGGWHNLWSISSNPLSLCVWRFACGRNAQMCGRQFSGINPSPSLNGVSATFSAAKREFTTS